MNVKHRWLGTALLLSCSTALYAQAEPVDLRSQISLMGSYTFEDSRRNSDEGLGAWLGYKFNLGERWGVEAAGFWQNFDNSSSDPVSWREWGGNLDALYHFSRSPRFSPYAVIGAGAMRLDNKTADVRSTGAFGHAGLGVTSQLFNRLGVRADARFRYADVSSRQNSGSAFREPIIRLGLFMPIGAAPMAAPPPPPPAEPAPPPPPPPAPAPAPEPEVIFEFDNGVLFDFDSSELRPEARSMLNEVAADIRQDTSLARVEVGGHTDDMGPAAYNKGLSQRRAQSVYDYLVSQGVDSNLLTVQGYGEDRPKYPNDSIENRQRNRRVELTVLERR